MGTNIVDTETAERDFERFAEEMELDLDTSKMDGDEKDGLEKHKRVIVLAIEKGALVVGDGGELTFTPRHPNDAEPVTFKEPTGATMLAMDKVGRNADMAKLNAVMANMTSNSAKVFARMKYRDYKVCTAIVTLFLD